MTQITGRVAVVTGGASGIGKGIAQALIESGAHVVIADIEEDVLQRTARELGAEGVRVDVSSLESVQALADEVLARHGRIDIVVNNAGVGPLGSVKDLQRADWEFMLGVNLWGVIHGVQVFLPILTANSDGGHIVNTGSMASFSSMPHSAAYNVSKYGVAALSETLAMELEEEGSPVRVTLFAPGTVRTNIKDSLRNRPDALKGELKDVDISEGPAKDMRWIDPIEAGRVVTHAIEENKFYALSHPEWWHLVQTRFDDMRDAFRIEQERMQRGE